MKTYIDVELEVAVRKYPVDTEKLKLLLHESKKGLTNSYIAGRLNVPQTMVEHWFRKDSYFAIPEPELWYDLKELLQIHTDEFDAPITEFEYRGGVYDTRNRIFIGDVAPTLACGCKNNYYLLEGV